MSDRPIVNLGDVLDVQNGFAFKSELFTDSAEGFPLIRIRDLGESSTVVRYLGEFREEFIVTRGDYLIGMDGDFEISEWRGPDALLNQRVCRLTKFSDRVLPEYVFFSIQKKLDEIHSNTAFVTVKHLSSKQVKGIQIPLPPLAEQRRIVDILKRADSIRRLRKQALETTRELIPALFVDMFGDPATNPKGWGTQTLCEVSDIGSGVTKGRKLDGQETVELPYLSVANVQDGYLNLTNVKTIHVKPAEIGRLNLQAGDLLMTEGGDPDKLGRCALWGGEITLCLHQNHVFRVRCNRTVVLPEYVRALAGSGYGKRYFLQVAKQTTGIASINKTQLSAFPVLVPPLDRQQEFERKCCDVRALIAQQENHLVQAEATQRVLMAQFFS